MNDDRWAEKHVTLLGVFHVVYHSLGFLVGIAIVSISSFLGSITGDPEANMIIATIGGLIGTVVIVVAIPGLIGGIGLLKRQSWARMLTMVIGAIDLLDIPLGTALGIYTFWVLMREEVVDHLQGASVSGSSTRGPR